MQYLIELRNHCDEGARRIIKRMCVVLFTEAAVVFIAAIPRPMLGMLLSTAAIFLGIILTALNRRNAPEGIVDFEHLSERVMLYVVFTFGEMIIAVASYFTGGGRWQWNTIYFSLMAFLIVVALFLSYGFVYDYLIDRKGGFDGMLYMALHIFIIFALNNITASLEFMREEEVALLPKMLFLICSLALYFIFLLSLRSYTKCSCRYTKGFMLRLALLTAVFTVLMLLLRENMYLNILISVIYVFAVFAVFYASYRKIAGGKEAEERPESAGALKESEE